MLILKEINNFIDLSRTFQRVLLEIHVSTAWNHFSNFAGATTPTPATTGPTGPATTAPPSATSENMCTIKRYVEIIVPKATHNWLLHQYIISTTY